MKMKSLYKPAPITVWHVRVQYYMDVDPLHTMNQRTCTCRSITACESVPAPCHSPSPLDWVERWGSTMPCIHVHVFRRVNYSLMNWVTPTVSVMSRGAFDHHTWYMHMYMSDDSQMILSNVRVLCLWSTLVIATVTNIGYMYCTCTCRYIWDHAFSPTHCMGRLTKHAPTYFRAFLIDKETLKVSKYTHQELPKRCLNGIRASTGSFVCLVTP